MAGQSVNFFSPEAMIAPDVAVQQLQLQRQQALIDALRQQSMQPIDPGRGSISWTQGLAKLADALVGRSMQKSNDAKSVALGQALMGRMGSMFGAPSSGLPGYGGGTVSTGPSPHDNPLAGGGDPSSGLSGLTNGQVPSQPSPMPPSSPGIGQPPPPQPPTAAGPSRRGPMSISDNPGADMMEFVGAPDKYWEARNAQIAPTDFVKTLQQAGIDPNSTLGRQLMQQQLAKQNYIAPSNARGGSWTTDPMTGQRTYNPNLPEGSEPLYDSSGNVRAIRTMDGVTQSIGDVAAAKAGGTERGQAPYDLVTVTDAQGNTYQVPKSSIPGVGGSGGSLNNYYGHGAPTGGGPGGPAVAPGPGGIGVQSGRGPGAQASDTQAGQNSANGFNTAIQGGVDAKNAIQTINSILDSAKGLPTGTGSGTISSIKSGVNAITGAAGVGPVFDRDQVAKFDEMKKNTSILGSQLASAAAGSNGVTDAKLSNALNAVPGAHYSPQAIQVVGSRLRGLQAAALGRAQAASAWQQAHGANSYPAFQSAWQSAYNPDVFEHMQRGPADFGAWVHSMHPADAARTMGQYRQMKALGAF